MSEFAILGAGIVGVTTALALQEGGHEVIIIDRRQPGREASYGNAGIVQVEVMEPYAFPRAALDVLRLAFGLGNDVRYHLAALPSAALPLALYYLNSAPIRYRTISQIYRQLIGHCAADHDKLIAGAGAEHLFVRRGYIQMHREARELDTDAAQAERYRKDFGVQSRILTNQALRGEEPCLKRDFAGAVHWQQSRSCVDPGGLVATYAALFRRRGGTLLEEEVRSLTQPASGWHVHLRNGRRLATENIVIALGAWSPSLLRPLGVSMPMIRKRGYHRHYKADRLPGRPLFDVAAAALYCPMSQGLRLTTGAEVARFASTKTPWQLARAERMAREVIDFGEAVEPEPWAGWRPCMPDMLPVVGAVPKIPGLWCNFGHGHQGFTLGPTSARLFSELAGGRAEDQVTQAVSPVRYL
ncbi:FAD-binding oxidoreductase [Mesorhizobium sp. M7A.F.Ca.US.006.04.2.1]|uniref:NAD(P)/FAD-dependent oxidoreductase n=2 Tax=Mesorhizobium TaxID=68287 RepID=UPI000FCB76EB|nr:MULTISPECIES: FAD-dependent oxidoreductase [unclassified Mesorhizobium]RUX71622.1 FAD-binding oxidoreductase [Mesorhizobium sp. M7A.F.Ca.US.005.03.1.1]RVA85372.1 FAD-binding oxidoreductase [Mesorhizobium sp. M7A.F.Ca.US.006.04.2.1]